MPDGTFLQDDFSGGVNWVDDPSRLDPNELADARNVYLVSKGDIKQREGFTQYNSSATGASDPVTGITMLEDWKANLIPVIQANGTIYKGDTAFPSTGAFSSILTETASALPAHMDVMWNTLVMTNAVDLPKTWSGSYGRPGGVKKTVDAGASYIDYTSILSDNDASTTMSLNSLDTVANGDYVVVGSRVPTITGIRFEVVNTNSNSQTAAVHYWDGSAWQAVSSLVDGTIASAGKSFGQSGDITFSAATSTLSEIDGMSRYWFRVSVTGALDSSVSISAVYIISGMQTLPNLPSGELIRPIGVKTSSDTSTTIKDQTTYAIDGTMTTKVSVGALTVTTGAIYIQAGVKFWRIRVSMDRTNFNANTVTMTAQYWNGTAWSALTITDGTSASSKTLAQTGTISFAPPSDWERVKLGVDLDPSYQVKLLLSAALSTTVEIGEVELEEYPESLKIHDLCLFHKNRLWLGNRQDAPHYIFCSAEFLPDVWNGADTCNIGIPSGRPVTALARFYNELMVATQDEIYLVEGYTPDTFGLLKINTGGIGVTAPKSCVAVGKYIYFVHSTGVYRFDGTGVELVSGKIDPLFDANDSTNQIPVTRFPYIEGRFNRSMDTVEWTVSRGSSATANNLLIAFEINYGGWWIHDIAAGSLVRLLGSSGQELYYHGGYVGKVYRDYNGTTDQSTAISSYITTRGFNQQNLPGWLYMFQGALLLMLTQSANSMTVEYAVNGATSFTSLGTMSMVLSGSSFIWQDLRVPIMGLSLQLKLSFSTSGGTWELLAIKIPAVTMRDRVVN